MKVKSPEQNNRQAATELGAILNQAYQSPLYQSGEQFNGGVFYKDAGRYNSLE